MTEAYTRPVRPTIRPRTVASAWFLLAVAVQAHPLNQPRNRQPVIVRYDDTASRQRSPERKQVILRLRNNTRFRIAVWGVDDHALEPITLCGHERKALARPGQELRVAATIVNTPACRGSICDVSSDGSWFPIWIAPEAEVTFAVRRDDLPRTVRIDLLFDWSLRCGQITDTEAPESFRAFVEYHWEHFEEDLKEA